MNAAKIVLNDWVRGRIPYFCPPPGDGDKSVVADTGAEPEKKVGAKKSASDEKEKRANEDDGNAEASAEGEASALETPSVKQVRYTDMLYRYVLYVV